jgi:hypothetical protein
MSDVVREKPISVVDGIISKKEIKGPFTFKLYHASKFLEESYVGFSSFIWR